MMKKELIIILLLPAFFYNQCLSQDFAGENKVICAKTEVVIGNPNSPDDYCYFWKAAEGISESEQHKKNPTVTPGKTTKYEVEVTFPDFSNRKSDTVTVKVKFGDITFNEEYITPDEGYNQAKATLHSNEGGGEYRWGLQKIVVPGSPPILGLTDAQTGCVIDQNTGWISQCANGGTLTVYAQKIEDQDCIAEENIEVNDGVKDVVAVDSANPTRKAKKGGTLHVVRPDEQAVSVDFEAIPNKQSFPSETPDWMGDVIPQTPYVRSWNHSFTGNGNFQIVAEEGKEVGVVVVGEEKVNTGINVSGEFLSDIIEYVKTGKLTDLSGLNNAVCSEALTLPNSDLSFSFQYESVNVGKYNSPDLGAKRKLSGSVSGFNVNGCVVFPWPSVISNGKIIFGVGVEWRTYLKAGLGFEMALNVESDESKQNPDWVFDGNVSFGGPISVGFDFRALVGVFGFQLDAFLSTGVKVNLNYNQTAKLLQVNSTIGGIEGTITGSAYVGSPDNSVKLSFTHVFLGPNSFGPYVIHDFNN